MRFSTIVLGFCFSSLAIAAENNLKEHETKLTTAQKWNDIAEGFKGVIPGSVIKEFSQSVDGKPFPSVRKLKYGIQLTQNNGMKVVIQFKSNGKISFNGKDWRFKPLDSIDNQVNQLALFLGGDQRKAGMNLIPSAFAASGADKGAFGLAALAFAAANSWKADACDEAGLTDELVEDCTLMAVAMRSDMELWGKQAKVGLFGEIRRAKVETGKDAAGMYPVSLKCPAEKNSGTIELISKDLEGWTRRYIVNIKKGSPVLVQSFVAEPGKNFEGVGTYKFNRDQSVKDLDRANSYAKMGLIINEEVCNGSRSKREKYIQALKANSEFIRSSLHKQEEDDSSDKKSVEST